MIFSSQWEAQRIRLGSGVGLIRIEGRTLEFALMLLFGEDERKENKYLSVGGLVAMGLDETGNYLLTVTHSGRGVFDTRTWNDSRATRILLALGSDPMPLT